MAEAGADMAEIAPVIALPNCESKRSEKWPCFPPRSEAGDDNLLPLGGLDLEPIICARPGQIFAVRAFAMMPSRPLRSASSKNFVPSAFLCRLKAMSL